MIQTTVKVTLILALLFWATISVIVAQPHDDAAMYSFFAATDGCSAPCFLGIRPGVTSEDQAFALLRAHPWVGVVTANKSGLSWTWNGQQPTFVSALNPDSYVAQIDFRAGLVDAIHVSTAISWGEFLYLFGLPDRETFLTSTAFSNRALIEEAAYFDHDFAVEIQTYCPLERPSATWYSKVFITWPAPGPLSYGRMTALGIC